MKKILFYFALMIVTFTARAQTCPDDNHPHAIDLGLPSGTKWACCNVGAAHPWDYGDYYSWGETETKTLYNWKTYTHCDGSEDTCHDLGSNITGTKYDVAHVKWGSRWVMPSSKQFNELLENCTSEWLKVNNGVCGIMFTGKNRKSIFLPAAGMRRSDRFESGFGFYYLSDLSRILSSTDTYIIYIDCVVKKAILHCEELLFIGETVRPIYKPIPKTTPKKTQQSVRSQQTQKGRTSSTNTRGSGRKTK